nr:unnamed protein product [Haemonchus contortus]
MSFRTREKGVWRSRDKTTDFLRKRKELEEECRRLSAQVEQNNAVWISRLQTARNQQTRFDELISCSVRIAKQNNEKKAVEALTERLAKLKMECCQFEKERAKLKKELEFQTITPLRVFMVNFAKIALRTYEMQEKLHEARRTEEHLKIEEAERRARVGASEYDVFDITFASQDLALNKTQERAVPTEPPRASLHVLPETAEEETASGGTLNSCESLCSTSPAQPPPASEQDVVLARTNAVKSYVTQQSEAVARETVQSDDNDSGELTRDEDERVSFCSRDFKQAQGMDVEVASNADEECVPLHKDNDRNGTLEERDTMIRDQDVGVGDFSDDDSAIDPEAEDDEMNNSMENGNEKVMEQTEYIEKQDAHSNSFFLPKKSSDKDSNNYSTPISSSQSFVEGQTSAPSSQQSQQNSMNNCAAIPNRKGPSSMMPNSKNPTSMDPSQEADAILNTLLKAPPSPIQEEMAFDFNCSLDNDEFDPTAALNISAHSNDPGADFLSLMESTNEKREKQRQNSSSPAKDFSFSIFGLGGDAASDQGSDKGFAFDFGGTLNGDEDRDGGGFQFDFNASSANDGSGEKTDKGFNLFDF